ncbi:MAG: DUF6624 domain-containing protein [Pseudobdellovibrionaceae bacterium]
MNKLIFQRLTLLLFLIANTACASQYHRVDSDISAYDQKVKKLKSNFENQPSNSQNKTWVQGKIDNMVEIDQYMRSVWNIPFTNSYSSDETQEFNKQFLPRSASVDAQNTDDLKELLKIYSWFKISEFGKKTDNQAWLIVQHADQDHAFQENILKILEQLFPLDETSPSNYAYLYDRVASSVDDLSKRRPQRYGTQGHCVGPGQWEPWPIENPDKVDELRKSVGLGTMEEYKRMFKDICH